MIVRNTAIVTLGRIPDARPQLRTLYGRRPPESRMAVLSALFSSKDEDELIRIARDREGTAPPRGAPACSSACSATPKALKFLAENPREARTALRYSQPDVRSAGQRTNPLLDGLRIEPTPEPTALVIFGASGDLTRRKLLPAIYQLARGQRLPARFNVLGVARSPMTDDQFRQHFHDSLKEFAGLDEARRRLVGAGARSRRTSRARWTIPPSTRRSWPS